MADLPLDFSFVFALSGGAIAVLAVVLGWTVARRLAIRRRVANARLEMPLEKRVRHSDIQKTIDMEKDFHSTARHLENPADAPQRGQKSAVTGPVAPSAANRTVFIADDDSIVIYSLTLRLKQLGFEVLRSVDSVSALVAIHKTQPDLIILDFNMPGGNGLSVCEMLKSDPLRSHIPIILYTCVSDPKVINRCHELGVAFVPKSSQSWGQIRDFIFKTFGPLVEKPPEPVRAKKPQIPSQTPPAPRKVDVPTKPTEPKSEKKEKTAKPPAASALKPAPIENPLVLLVDNARKLEKMHKWWTRKDVQVEFVESVKQGYWSCFSARPDAIVFTSDILFSENRNALAQFGENPTTASIPLIVAVTEEAHSAKMEQMAEGVDPCSVVPAQAEKIAVLFEEIFAGPPASRNDAAQTAKSPAQAPAEISLTQAVKEAAVTSEESLLRQVEEDFSFVGKEARAADNADEKEPVAPFRSANPDRKNPIVLCIDDDPEISREISVRLAPYGVAVESAYTGMDGFWRGLKLRPDAIILDQKMPDGEGNYIFSRFKQHPLTKDIPIIILSGYASLGLEREMMGFGLEAYLSKPLDFDKLLVVLKQRINLEGIANTILAE